MFTTPTGQTGLTAYKYEAAQIANAQRDLNARFRRLLEAAHEEAPDLFEYKSDWEPTYAGAESAKRFCEFLQERTR